MNNEQVKALIEQGMDAVEVLVEGGDGKFQVTIVSGQFDGLSLVKKQQLVYSCLNDNIRDGSIHAVSMNTFTPAEWEKQKLFQ